MSCTPSPGPENAQFATATWLFAPEESAELRMPRASTGVDAAFGAASATLSTNEQFSNVCDPVLLPTPTRPRPNDPFTAFTDAATSLLTNEHPSNSACVVPCAPARET